MEIIESNNNEEKINKVYEYCKAISKYERKVELISKNYKWVETYAGYIINLKEYNELKDSIHYDNLKEYITDEDLCKEKIKELFESEKIDDIKKISMIIEIKKKNKLKKLLESKNEFKLISKELCDTIYKKKEEIEPKIYIIDYPSLLLFLSQNELVSFSINDNILNRNSFISYGEIKILNLAKSLFEFHNFTNKIEMNLKNKPIGDYKDSGFLVNKTWIDNWKKFSNYDRIKFDEKDSIDKSKLINQIISYIKNNNEKLEKPPKLEALCFNSTYEFEEYTKNNALTIVNSEFYYLESEEEINEKYQIKFTSANKIIKIYINEGSITIDSYENMIYYNNIIKIKKKYEFELIENNFEMKEEKKINEEDEDEEKSLWDSFISVSHIKDSNKKNNTISFEKNFNNNKDNKDNIIGKEDILKNNDNNNNINNNDNINENDNINNINNDNNINIKNSNNINSDNINNDNINNNNIIIDNINNNNINENNVIIKKMNIKNNFKLGYPHIGLVNIGATCYMNATLQCFCHIEKFINYFKYNPQCQNIKNNNLSSSFKLLIDNLWPDDDSIKSAKTKAYSPNEFKEKISSMNPLFKGIAANDSKDLVNFIIMTLHSELNNNNNILISEPDNIIIDQTNQQMVFNCFVQDFMAKNHSIISDLFYSMNCNVTQCTSCNTKIYNYQTYFFINFPLEEVRKFKNNMQNNCMHNNCYGFNNYINWSNNEVNIYDCFENERKINYMSGENSMYCNYCKTNTNSMMYTYLVTSPEILVLILNRGKGIEFNVKINFSEELNLYNYIEYKNTGYKYKLIGVITHIGESSMSGHFIAYCYDQIQNKWYKYNDAIVNEVSNFQNEVINFAMPYLLFYQKIDV